MRTTRLCWTLAAVLVAVVGCSSTVSGTPAAAGDLPPGAAAIVSAENQARGEPTADAVDACALISAAEVEAAIGKGAGAKAGPAGGNGGQCTWENEDNYYSVTLDIGQTGTAASGLPAWDPSIGPEKPLPDGMRSWGGGAVEFVAGDRDCQLQVATVGDFDGDQRKAIALIKKVQAQL
jgi:hypothetical protein